MIQTILDWIKKEMRPDMCDSVEFIYDHMDSQSGRILPVIYQPFDPAKRMHWCDRGACYDFLYATGGGRLLDFGPGDGWPSLITAPYTDEVIGVDASRRRVEVCRENAERTGIKNVRFVHSPPGARLPFDNDSFDGAMAASPVQQTPDPHNALNEIYRVLKPGGRLRMHYETLERYRDGKEQEIWVWPVNASESLVIIYNRYIDDEFVDQYALRYSITAAEIKKMPGVEKFGKAPATVLMDDLERLHDSFIGAKMCRTVHPSVETLRGWMTDVGFSDIIQSRSGDDIAGDLFDNLEAEKRPVDIESIDFLIHPLVKQAVDVEDTRFSENPSITAVK